MLNLLGRTCHCSEVFCRLVRFLRQTLASRGCFQPQHPSALSFLSKESDDKKLEKQADKPSFMKQESKRASSPFPGDMRYVTKIDGA